MLGLRQFALTKGLSTKPQKTITQLGIWYKLFAPSHRIMLPAILHSLNKKKHKSLPTVTSAGDENEWHGLEKDDTPIITRGENTYHQNPVTWLTTDP